MKKIAIIGAGLMGTGLARLFAEIGWPVAVWDPNATALARLIDSVPTARAGRDLGDTVAGAELVIEAIVERAQIKQGLFAELAALGGDAVLATNSSVIPVGVVGVALSDDDAARVIGTHFWNPPDLIPLVEVIEGPRTAAATVARTLAILNEAGREPVHVRQDVVPGNRLQHALWREAMALFDEGVCAPEDIDRIVKRSFGARLAVLGPLENADLVGLALTKQIHDVVLPTLSRATTPSVALAERLAAGRNFYDDASDARFAQTRARLAAHLEGAFGGSST